MNSILKGKYGEKGHQPFSMEKALNEMADYVVFNGSVGSTTGDKSITANLGETVRLFVGNGGPNLVSSFHVIGEIFDRVYPEGGFNINTDVQTTLIPAGGSTIVEFAVDVPGTFVIVDHSIFRTFNKGSLATLTVAGEENLEIYSGKQEDKVYLPEGSAAKPVEGKVVPTKPAKDKATRISRGEGVYKDNCAACHQPDGVGIPGAFPPLAKSDYLEDQKKTIEAVVSGLSGKLIVNGKEFNGVMPAWDLSDEDVANVLTYIYNSWGNKGTEITASTVGAVRKKSPH